MLSNRSDSLESLCRAEVIALHEFFTDWFCGRLADDDAVFARCEQALGPGFQLVSPRGVVDQRAPLLVGIRGAYGRRREFRIWITDFAWRELSPEQLGLASYVEWQEADGATSSRISTAIMAAAPDAPGGVVWLHVHETWTPTYQATLANETVTAVASDGAGS